MISFKIQYNPIGIIHSPHKKTSGIPIQPVFALEFQGRSEIFPEYAKGLADLEGFSHVILIYHFHKAGQSKLKVKPFLEDKYHGIFSTRAPVRPVL
ncbi:MAG: SAM-dependent methyltransferase [Bacteroidetes bacterium]|nr:SAM-dependent methyltransferase [Bacteroidota bacterium]